MPKTKSTSRLQFLDWARGFGAVIMLQGHTFHSLLRQDLRTSSTFVLSDFVGGMPSAIFLFLTGVTLAFLMDSRERQGATAPQRVIASLRRAGYILGLAFLVRLQLWLFGLPGSPWTDLLRVDVLNCMGVALGVLSVMAVFRTADRIRLCAVLGVAVAAASPLISQIDWSGVHPLVKAYIAPDYASFGFFSDAFGRRKPYFLYLLIAAALVPIYGMSRSPFWLLVLGPFVAFFGTGYFSGYAAIASELFPGEIRAAAMGLSYNIGRGLSAVAPFAVGALALRYGIGPAFFLQAGAFLMAALLALALPETRGQTLD